MAISSITCSYRPYKYSYVAMGPLLVGCCTFSGGKGRMNLGAGDISVRVEIICRTFCETLRIVLGSKVHGSKCRA